jgi:hypothetical protein
MEVTDRLADVVQAVIQMVLQPLKVITLRWVTVGQVQPPSLGRVHCRR